MSEHRDRAQLLIDGDVKEVLEFMQQTIPANKLLGVAGVLPDLARLLWGHNPQEPVRGVSLEVICLGRVDGPLRDASEFLGVPDAGDGSVAGAACR